MTIFPGETEIHEFLIPFSSASLQKAVASYKQYDYITLDVETTTFTDVEDNVCKACFSLTQNQTLQLRNIPQCEVQINVLTIHNERFTSEPMMVQVGEQFYRHAM